MPWTALGAAGHVPERGRAVWGRPGTPGVTGRAAAAGAVAQLPAELLLLLVTPGLRAQSLCGPFPSEFNSVIFVVPSSSGCSVMWCHPGCPGTGRQHRWAGAEWWLLLCPSLVAGAALCCPACRRGLSTSRCCGGHQQVALLPHGLLPPPRPQRILLDLTTAPQRSRCPSRKADLPHAPGSNSCWCFLSLLKDVVA